MTNHDDKRRRILKAGGALGVAGAFGGGIALTALFPKAAHTALRRHHRTPVQTDTAARSLTKFVDELQVPPVIAPSAQVNGVPFYEVTMRRFQKKLHRDLPATTLWGTTACTRRRPSRCGAAVRSRSDGETTSRAVIFCPIDPTIHGAEPSIPSVRTVVHLHGMKTMPDSDGYPEAWFTNGFKQTGPFFELTRSITIRTTSRPLRSGTTTMPSASRG